MPALVAAVIAGVERQRRNARMVSVAIGVCVLLVTAALAPLVTTYMSEAFAALQGVTLRGSHFPLIDHCADGAGEHRRGGMGDAQLTLRMRMNSARALRCLALGCCCW